MMFCSEGKLPSLGSIGVSNFVKCQSKNQNGVCQIEEVVMTAELFVILTRLHQGRRRRFLKLRFEKKEVDKKPVVHNCKIARKWHDRLLKLSNLGGLLRPN